MAAARPLSLTAAATPIAAARTTRVAKSTLDAAARRDMQPVKSMPPVASKAAFNMLIQPTVTTVTMAATISDAARARCQRRQRYPSNGRTSEKSSSFRAT